MLKKLILAIIVVGIGVVFYTEKTGKTDFSSQIYTFVIGEEPPSKNEEKHYTLAKKKEELSDAEQAKKDAKEYHKEAKKFAKGTSNAVNEVNEKAK